MLVRMLVRILEEVSDILGSCIPSVLSLDLTVFSAVNFFASFYHLDVSNRNDMVGTIELLLKNEGNLGAKDGDGNISLRLASLASAWEVVRLLIMERIEESVIPTERIASVSTAPSFNREKKGDRLMIYRIQECYER